MPVIPTHYNDPSTEQDPHSPDAQVIPIVWSVKSTTIMGTLTVTIAVINPIHLEMVTCIFNDKIIIVI